MDYFERQFNDNYAIVKVNLVNANLNEAISFREYLDEVILLSKSYIIVDLSECITVDSTFIGAIIMGLKRLRVNNRDMFVVEPQGAGKEVLNITSMGKLFKIFTTVDEAITLVERLVINGDQEINEFKGQLPDNSQGFPGEEDKTEDILETTPHDEIVLLDRLGNAGSGENTEENGFDYYQENNPDFEFVNEAYDSEVDEVSAEDTDTATDDDMNEIKDSSEEELVIEKVDETDLDEDDYRKGTIEWAFGISN